MDSVGGVNDNFSHPSNICYRNGFLFIITHIYLILMMLHVAIQGVEQ